MMITGRCEAMDGLVGPHQGDLDELGRQLQATLAAGMPVTTG